MAAIAHVFTIGYVANLLGEDEDWLFELSTDMFPEDGCLWVYGVGEDGVPAFTRDGIDNLSTCARSSPKNAPLAAPQRAPKRPNSLACGGHRMETRRVDGLALLGGDDQRCWVAQAQGVSSARRLLGQLLTSLVNTSVR